MRGWWRQNGGAARASISTMESPSPLPYPPTAFNPLLDRITLVYPTLSRTERQVADFVLANPLAFTRTPISHITTQSGASAPTIMRFCRAAGFKGLTDLKLSMVAALGDGARQDRRVAPAHAGNALLDTASELIERLRQHMQGHQVQDAMTLLASAETVTCMASYHVQNAATYARDCLLRHGIRALTPDSPDYPGAPASGRQANGLGLFFCFGIPDAAMVDAITRYRRHGRGAIAISNASIAPFVQASLAITVGPAIHGRAAMSSADLLPHLLLTDLLVEGSDCRRRAAAAAWADSDPGAAFQ
jgi:DNA-binding MurR/RpiR family transcriptional regulator